MGGETMLTEEELLSNQSYRDRRSTLQDSPA